MFYQCNKCHYEFKAEIPTHPHPINRMIRYGVFGCPVCQQNALKAKVCPKCGSIDTTEILKLEDK